MPSRKTFKLPEQGRFAIESITSLYAAKTPYEVEIRSLRRSIRHNRLLWKILEFMAENVTWWGEKLTEEEWKDVATALCYNQKAVRGEDGHGFIILGKSTRTMTKDEFKQVIMKLEQIAAEKGIDQWPWEAPIPEEHYE